MGLARIAGVLPVCHWSTMSMKYRLGDHPLDFIRIRQPEITVCK